MNRKYPKPIDFINVISTIDELDNPGAKKSIQLLRKWGESSLVTIHRQGRDEEFWRELLTMFPEHFFERHYKFSKVHGRKPKKEVRVAVNSYGSLFYPMFK